MKRIILLIIACTCLISAHAAYLRNVPRTLTQPDGSVLHCYASGDEYFNYLHDENGFTIMQHPQTGFFVYADKQDGKLVATNYVAGKVDPASKNLQPFNLISPEEWMARRKAWHENDKQNVNRDVLPNHGTLNNICIFVRFSDDAQFTNTYSSIDNMFNDESTNAVSLKTYFNAASYGAINIPTYFYPGHNGETIISYQDTYPRSYYQPYNASTNTNGYNGSDERRNREFSLLERAVNYVNSYYPVSSSLNLDNNEDGCVDNVCFIVRGDVGDWGVLLWPHQWTLWDRTVTINGKQVWTFNFQLADATDYFNTSTMCHEMNHSLGAPDLYHYDYGEYLHPVGTWDLMEYNMMPPQHCGAYMKMKYGHWIDDIPEITEPGTYTLNPISSSTPTNVAYKIATSDPNQFYVVEYRDKTSLFETALPGSGLLVYRIDTRFEGGASYNPDNGIYDEVYLFRPGGSTSSDGDFYSAYFSSNVGRTEFSSATDPNPFFTDGTIDNNFRIYDISSAGSTISFKYGPDETLPEGIYVGDGGTTTNSFLPSYSYYNYSLTQQIYTSDELGEEGIITSIAFYNGGTTKTRTYDFYMKNTTKSTFSGTSDWIPVSASDMVFSGTVTMAANTWTVINFNTPFFYDGFSNLVLVADDNTGSYSSGMACRVFSAPSQAIRIYSDGTNYSPYSASSYSGTVMNVKNQIVLNKIVSAMQVYADYYPDMNDPTSPYVRVHWGTGLNNIEDFERGDFSMFNWQLDPAYSWVITTNDPYEGNYCMKSSNEGIASSTSSMECMLQVPNDGQISFFSKISSESGWDYGCFYIDGVQQGSYSGNGTWGERTFAVTAGAHTFKWSYEKDGSVNRYDDCFYVDYIRFSSSNEFAYDFDNSRLPVGWTTIDADGDGYNWYMATELMGTGYGHNGSNDCVLSQSYDNSYGVLYPDNYLVSEQVNITNGSHFTFWACAQDNAWTAEHFGVFVSLGSNNNPADFQEVQSWTMTAKGGGGRPIEGKASRGGGTRTQGTWYYYDVDLSAYVGKGYIALRHYNCSDWFYLDVDDVAFSDASKSGSTAYCVYRAHCDGSEMQLIARNVTGNEYIDYDWTSLAPGSYKYGVCVASDGVRGTINWSETDNGNTQHQPLTREAAEAMGIDVDPNTSFNDFNNDPKGNRNMWDLVYSFNAAEGGHYGVVTDGQYIYTSNWGYSAAHNFYKYDMEGNMIEGFEISGCGYLRGMTFDGQYIYGVANSSTVYCVDLNNHTLVSTFTSEYGAMRCISYDPVRDGFWVVGNWIGTLTLIDRQGDIIQVGPEPDSASDCAYFKDENNVEHVYLFTQPSSDALIYDYDISSNTISSEPIFDVRNNLPGATGTAGGCCISYYAGKVVLFADVQQSPNLVGVFELKDGQVAWSNCIEKTNPFQSIDLQEGWNWWSTYIELDGIDGLGMLENSLGTSGVAIKSQEDFVEYSITSSIGTWTGGLEVINNASGYKVLVSEDCESVMTGTIAVPSNHPVTLTQGWTWIGYPVRTAQTVTSALSGFTPADGDILKGQDAYTTYSAGLGWTPADYTLTPGQCYMYYSNASGNKTLVLHQAKGGAPAFPKERHYWQANHHASPDNLSVMAVVEVNGEELANETIELGAFVDGECRGSAKLHYVETLDRYIAFLTVTGREGDRISFGMVDTESGRTNMESETRLDFASNAIVGGMGSPYPVRFGETAAMPELRTAVSVYPNPVDRDMPFRLDIPEGETVAEVLVANALGEVVSRETGDLARSTMHGLPTAGVYTLKVTCKSGNVYISRVVVK